MSAQKDDVGAEGQCAEGDGGGSGAEGDCVSVKSLLKAGYIRPENK